MRVLWGDTHLHTVISLDAGFYGTKLTPEDAFRFARGDEVVSTTGIRAKLDRPLDFLVVSDHSDYMGLPEAIMTGSALLRSNPIGERWYQEYHAAGKVTPETSDEWKESISTGKSSFKDPALMKETWARSVIAAEKYNEPGRFTAFIGFEWTSQPKGNNLHRNVIFRDGKERALQVLPLTSFEGQDPELLWRYLAGYERKTGGAVLAIPHNPNLSGGMMFSDKTFGGKPIDRSYAEQRAKWEPVVEATQTKGDSETDPAVSPDDEFANFERWDRANILFTKQNTPEDQKYNYIRPALTRGLKLEQQLGANPFKFGMVGGTDAHTGLSTASANYFFGVRPQEEPSAKRLLPPKTAAVVKLRDALLPFYSTKPSEKKLALPWEIVSAGLTGVWVRENTRESIFDALRRKEVYATTGPRMTVRVFAGWHFAATDVGRSDFATNGYAQGVPMGGDLCCARGGELPTLLILAAKDPQGANLDRVQVIKGWLDRSGVTHEKIYNVVWSGNRSLGPEGKLPEVGSTVNVREATYTNSIGAPVLSTAWTDSDFDAAERAYYYIRVIEIPTPRWTTYDAKQFGVKLPPEVPAAVTQRAYTSPIWYTPSGQQ
jgi:hypothetical protein